ncbi:lipase chaperone [Photobacterium marinum]|uniref:Lipase chaperone n=1 Tax=Photobacterium marinum TaxID=1056511 RepID=L8JDP3_9GAMM|nr:lipase secretion chaperone [Photobacterium marinum]ELR65532.1 lipase chaperone [Photobacterium marinum]
MKKIALVILGLVGAAGAVFYFHTGTTDEPTIQVASQQDTKIDSESSRDTFDYFLSGLGEADLETLKQHFESYNNQQTDAFQLDTELFEKFIRYKTALQTLEPSTFDQLNLDSLRQLNDQLIAMQQRFFTPEERALLFGEENQLRELALKKLELKKLATDEEDFQNQWQQEIDQLPPDLQSSYRNAQLLPQLQTTNNLDPQERFLANQELVGTEAAARLEKLAGEREAFQNKVSQYLEERETIQNDGCLNYEEQEKAIEDLRNSTFSEKHKRRIQTLESIHDEQAGNNS